MEILENIKEGFLATPTTEWIAFVLSLTYVILIAKKMRWGWICALLSSGIYVYLCFVSNLFLETGLQTFYLAMAAYGWIIWKEASPKERKIFRWPLQYQIINLIVGIVVMLILGYLMAQYTAQKRPYLDAFITTFSLAATFMDVKRVLEGWLYWIIIDLAAIFLYAGQGLYLTGLKFLIFTIIALFAYISWYKMYKNQNIEDSIHRS